ncbi:conserved hypothetical protein [Candidatus Koribacter versatilis Ellin345]|uniref:DUF4382 domain-containing protein n=1 Tax=Koribacter versatilis (strain Ellin345) TaxID=204669 RepID=Q1IP88_KORVE|nr:DUF4382 domain-containing protein [Candidatus Koribacter versatilis]ABF41312.1 conserved hypothetical protein [Candidatus Koribacter versatilis Ellin345]
MKPRILVGIMLSLAAACLAILIACGGSSSMNSNKTTGTVNLSVSDPPTCAAPAGPYSNVWVTIKDVQIHQSASAGPSDAGWVDLTPNLKSAPQQVDLLGIAGNNCFLAMLGSNVELQAGSYQQIRIYLSDSSDASKLTTNHCSGSDVNCVVTGGNTFTLELSSESNTGIKIPSGQLAGGNFTIAAGEVKDLNIDFDACLSIVHQGNGKYRLKPVLHAGEVQLTSSSVTGSLVDSISHTSIVGGAAVVGLEQKDANGIDRVIMQTVTDARGNFVFCPVPAGTYDVVAVAVNGAGVAYAATITTGVQPGNALGNVPMVAQVGVPLTNAEIDGEITSSTGSAAAAADITFFAMQSVSIEGSTVNVIIPLAQQWSSATASMTTDPTSACATATAACVAYQVFLPAMWPNVGAYAASGATYTQNSATPVTYAIGADAFIPGSAGTSDCTPPGEITTTGGTPMTVSPGSPTPAPTLAFTGCQ